MCFSLLLFDRQRRVWEPVPERNPHVAARAATDDSDNTGVWTANPSTISPAQYQSWCGHLSGEVSDVIGHCCVPTGSQVLGRKWKFSWSNGRDSECREIPIGISPVQSTIAKHLGRMGEWVRKEKKLWRSVAIRSAWRASHPLIIAE